MPATAATACSPWRRAAAFFSDEEDREDFAIVLASGARAKVLALAAVLGLSGSGLTALELSADDAPGSGWAAVVMATGTAFVLALGLFAYVSWHLWPARAAAHALDDLELPTLQRRFALVPIALTTTIGAGLVLGVVADALTE